MAVKLPKVKTRAGKRVGRGYGSGKGGHTSGRGQKGQKSRRNINVLFEGIKMKKSFIKKLPLKRGKGKFKPSDKPIIVNLKVLSLLPAGTKVNLDSLVKAQIVDKKDAYQVGVKILGDGEIKKKLTIELPISKSAAKKIKKAGGNITEEKKKTIAAKKTK